MTPEEFRRKAAEDSHRIYKAQHFVNKVSDIPDQAHFAVICEESMNYNDGYGDDRLGTSYSTMNYLHYIKFDSEEALEAWIISNHSKKTFKVINVKAVTVELQTKITIKDV